MGGSLVLLLRATVLLAFLAAMPVLALPVVGKQYDAWLLGESQQPAAFAQVSVQRLAAPVANLPPEVQAEPDLPREPFAATDPRRRAVGQAEKFETIPRQLQELGAEYFRLESIAGESLGYRFCCTMKLATGAAYSRQFEATAANPVEAMQQVLGQVKAWHGGLRKSPATRTASRPKE